MFPSWMRSKFDIRSFLVLILHETKKISKLHEQVVLYCTDLN